MGKSGIVDAVAFDKSKIQDGRGGTLRPRCNFHDLPPVLMPLHYSSFSIREPLHKSTNAKRVVVAMTKTENTSKIESIRCWTDS